MQNIVRRAGPERRHRQRRPVPHAWRGSRSRRCARTACCRRASAGFAQNETRVDAVAADARRRPRRWLSVRRRRRRSRQLRHRRAPALVSPKGGAVVRAVAAAPSSTSTAASVSTATTRAARRSRVDPATGEPAERVTPLVRARGAEVGVRTVRIPHLQTSADGVDAEPGLGADLRRRCRHDRSGPPEPSLRRRVAELLLAAPMADVRCRPVAVARALHRRRSGRRRIPGAVSTVVSAGVTVDSLRNVFGSVRWRYFGPRAARSRTTPSARRRRAS